MIKYWRLEQVVVIKLRFLLRWAQRFIRIERQKEFFKITQQVFTKNWL